MVILLIVFLLSFAVVSLLILTAPEGEEIPGVGFCLKRRNHKSTPGQR